MLTRRRDLRGCGKLTCKDFCRLSRCDAVALVAIALSNCAGVKVGTTDPSPPGQGSSSNSVPCLLTSMHRTICKTELG